MKSRRTALRHILLLPRLIIIGLGMICITHSSKADIECDIVIDANDNLKATVTLSGSGVVSGNAPSNFGGFITQGTGVIFNAINNVELGATIPSGSLSITYGNTTHDVESVIFRSTADDLFFGTDTLFGFTNGQTISASGTFAATFAAGINGETLDDVVPGTYNVTASDSSGAGSVPFVLRITKATSPPDNSAAIAQLKKQIKKVQGQISRASKAGNRSKAAKLKKKLKTLTRKLAAL